MIPQGMNCRCTVAEAIAAAVPHHVLPQLLRPMVTAMVPADAVLTKAATLEEAQRCSSSVTIWPPSSEDTETIVECFAALRALPKCGGLSVRVELPSLSVISRELAGMTHVTSLSLYCGLKLDSALDDVSLCRRIGANPSWLAQLPRSFASLGNLTTLRFEGCGPADATFCESVGKLRKLTSLSLCQADPIDAAAFGAHIAPLPISTLMLQYCTSVGSGFYVPSRIGHISSLTTLSLAGCCNLFCGFDYLSGKPVCDTLTSLDISSCRNVEDDTLAVVGTMTKLRVLSLRECECVQDEDFELLHRLTHLEELDLAMWECADADTITAVAEAFPAMRRLDLSHSGSLRDDAVVVLASIRPLEWVNLHNCYNVSAAAVRELRTWLVVQGK